MMTESKQLYVNKIQFTILVSANIAVCGSTYFNYDELSPMHNSNSGDAAQGLAWRVQLLC